MKDLTLFYRLTGYDPNNSKLSRGKPPLPGDQSCFFLAKGHSLEYIQVDSRGKRIACLFFGPQEFIVRCHPVYSGVISLDNANGDPFTYGAIFRTLRGFPETRTHYQEFRQRYQQKVAERLRVMNTLTVPERFQHLRRTQPWVLDLAKTEDIASYVGTSAEVVEKLMRKR